MRLSDEQVRIIRETVAEIFGPRANVRVFGSRADDTRRGGDIDLYIETESAPAAELAKAELVFLCRLKRKLGDQKIDLLLDYPARRHRPPVFELAKASTTILMMPSATRSI